MSKNQSKTPFLDALDEIDDLIEDAKNRLGALLTRRGWKCTCQTPGSFWLWEKKLDDGRIVLVDSETARRYEEENCGEERTECC